MRPSLINRNKLPTEFTCSAIAFLGRSSFEERCFSAYDALTECNFVSKRFLVSSEEANEAKELRKKYGIASDKTRIVDTNDPLQTQRTIANEVSALRVLKGEYSIVLDITSFRREELLLLVGSLSKVGRDQLKKTHFVYSKASAMGDWLSNNVREVRSVVGFPGEVSNAKKTHLMLLVGIEHHRALAIIQAYEPYSISLGMVPKDKSVNEEIYERNRQLTDWLIRHFDQVRRVFDFPATDPSELKKILEMLTSELNEFNVVIAPLNSKLSTLAVGAFAIEHPQIQLCYAEVDVYNAGDYSQPSEDIVWVPASDIL